VVISFSSAGLPDLVEIYSHSQFFSGISKFSASISIFGWFESV
jgi:hypothetical protein